MSWALAEYKRQKKKLVDAMGFGLGDEYMPSLSSQEEDQEAILKEKRDKAMAELEAIFQDYALDDPNSPYFNKIAKQYRDYAMDTPIEGIRDQRREALSDLTFALSRQGLRNSSVAAKREALAKKLFAKAQVDAATKGRDISEDVRSEVISKKGELMQDIDLATNPDSVISGAESAAFAASQPQEFDPMLDVFLKLTEGLAVRQEIEDRKRRQAMLDYYLDPGSKGSVSVID